MRIVTIGGYGFTKDKFLQALKKAGVDTFLDVRQRRGVRGAQYSFLNSGQLQQALVSANIKYLHVLDLAPTSLIREAQKQDDMNSGTAKRDRTKLSPVFIERYRSGILSKFDVVPLSRFLDGASTVALFCVEGPPVACHRSLAAEYLARALGINSPVEHLRP